MQNEKAKMKLNYKSALSSSLDQRWFPPTHPAKVLKSWPVLACYLSCNGPDSPQEYTWFSFVHFHSKDYTPPQHKDIAIGPKLKRATSAYEELGHLATLNERYYENPLKAPVTYSYFYITYLMWYNPHSLLNVLCISIIQNFKSFTITMV